MNGQPWTDEIMLRWVEESAPADLRPAFAMVENEDIRALVGDEDICAPGGIGIRNTNRRYLAALVADAISSGQGSCFDA